MDQLSSMDASFLHLETPETPMHVGSLMLFELPEPAMDLLTRPGENVSQLLATINCPFLRNKTIGGASTTASPCKR